MHEQVGSTPDPSLPDGSQGPADDATGLPRTPSERLLQMLVLSLYRGGGRQAEALGVDLGDGARALRGRVPDGEQDLAEAVAQTVGPLVPRVRPAQLPATASDFTGHAGLVAELTGTLGAAEGPEVAVSALTGIGGVGKTTLAVHVAHAVRGSFPDGQLYVDLQGTGPRAADPEAVLGSILRALGVAGAGMPDSLGERTTLYRSMLAGRSILVVLDNARDAAQVRPLLPGGQGCAVLVTSRARMVDLAGAHLVELDVMSPEEALQLFSKIAGAERVAPERTAALDVVAACGFLPLAIRVAASRLAARRTWTVTGLATRLADERRRLDELHAGNLAVKATFELGYGQLDPGQARAFRLLGLAEGPDVSLAAAAAVLDLPVPRAECVLEALVDTSLLESAAPGRYRFHDLIRLYARSCAERDETPAERDAALSRLLDFYLVTAAAVYAIERPGDRLVDHLAPARYPGLAFGTQNAALDWLFAESDCLLACVQQCATGPFLRRAADLLMASVDLAESGANSRRYEAASVTVSRAAGAVHDARAEGRARTCLAYVFSLTGRFRDADDETKAALKAGTAARDALVIARVSNQRGIIALYAHRHEDALAHLRHAVDVFRTDLNHSGEAGALANLSRVHLALGDTEAAIGLCLRSVRIYAGLGATFRLANAKYSLGMALTEAGRFDEALAQLTDALDAFSRNRQRPWVGMAHSRIAEAHLGANRPARAVKHAEKALALRGLGGEWRRGMMLTVLGKALKGIRQSMRAETCWREALSIYAAYGRQDSPEAAEVRSLLSTA